MRRRHCILQLFFLAFLHPILPAATSHKLAQQHYTIADGLDNVRVYFLMPDQAGPNAEIIAADNDGHVVRLVPRN